MAGEPRDPALAAMWRATLRVGDGSGVLVTSGKTAVLATANHVVEGDGPHRIRWPGGFTDATVLTRNKSRDLAVLAAPRALEGDALALPEPEEDAVTGDDVWASGFPGGWNGEEPVLARGAIVGVGDQNWVNLDGTWGNSGGPLCRPSTEGAIVIGILLGNASDPSARLRDYRRLFEQHREMEKTVKEPRDNPSAPPEIQVLRDLWGATFRLAKHDVEIGLAVSDLIAEHFRTGFLLFTPASDLRKLLA
jgi:hypothetical protein